MPIKKEQAEKDRYFMEQALVLAEAALSDGEFPVGCVIVNGERILAQGGRIGTVGALVNEVDHAEMRALKQLYLQGDTVNRRGCTIYTTLEPCLMCFGAILLSGIGRIVYAYEDVMGGGCACDLSRLPVLYRERSVQVLSQVLRKKSLALFKTFFQKPDCAYWPDSPLARYTLAQE